MCVTASFLHEFWLTRDFRVEFAGNAFHVDYLSVPGAGILDLAELFKIEYADVDAPIDVMLVCTTFRRVLVSFINEVHCRLLVLMTWLAADLPGESGGTSGYSLILLS